uniref:Uncharacterized protein n=1 Tax=uncultured bacterium contig00055 TaxID=1181539 RepID=A0A806KJX8_9BACT|nr:FIG01166001: hypothetical protein [uncultured bacterium contig00055]
MKSFTKELWFNTKKPREFINITGEVEAILREQIFYGEFDGQRRKRVLVKIIGE